MVSLFANQHLERLSLHATLESRQSEFILTDGKPTSITHLVSLFLT